MIGGEAVEIMAAFLDVRIMVAEIYGIAEDIPAYSDIPVPPVQILLAVAISIEVGAVIVEELIARRRPTM